MIKRHRKLSKPKLTGEVFEVAMSLWLEDMRKLWKSHRNSSMCAKEKYGLDRNDTRQYHKGMKNGIQIAVDGLRAKLKELSE